MKRLWVLVANKTYGTYGTYGAATPPAEFRWFRGRPAEPGNAFCLRNGFARLLKGCPEIIEVVIIVYSTLVEGNGDGVTNVRKACG
jgi:hypothetical protein